MYSTARFKFGLQISNSHGPTKGGGVRGLSSQGLLKVNIFFANPPNIVQILDNLQRLWNIYVDETVDNIFYNYFFRRYMCVWETFEYWVVAVVQKSIEEMSDISNKMSSPPSIPPLGKSDIFWTLASFIVPGQMSLSLQRYFQRCGIVEFQSERLEHKDSFNRSQTKKSGLWKLIAL